MRPRYWLPRYHGAFADRRRNRARIVPKRIQGTTFSEPDVELHCFARLYRNVTFHEWLERAARHAEGNVICSCGEVCNRVSAVGFGHRTHHDAGHSVLRLDRCVRDVAILPILELAEWNVERFPASGQTPKSLKLQFKFGDLGV
jgi:hypothetical protein